MRAALAICAVALLSACHSENAPPAAVDPPSEGGADEMCAEHGVLESLCTVCNPALATVFRARGDFCEEHGLPESFCPVCHPERGGMPDEPVAIDRAPADGTRVRLASPELARRVGIRVVQATRAPDAREVVATARIVYDPTRLARLNPRAAGVIRAIHADVGTVVAPGDGLVTIASAEVGVGNTRLAAARSRLATAEANVARREELEGVVSQRDLLESRRERDEARAELAAHRSGLGVVGRTRGSEYTLSSPIAGVVTHRAGTIGAFVDTDIVLVQVVDPSMVWAEIDVPEDEVGRLAAEQSVILRMDALGDRTFEGTLEYLAPEIDPRTRTALGRVPLENADRALRAHMFGRARVQVPRAEPAVTVPRDAVQRARGATLVFVQIAEELFEARRVEVLDRPGEPDQVEVRGRLEPGEPVVVDGAFLLRTETVSDSIGAGCCEGEE